MALLTATTTAPASTDTPLRVLLRRRGAVYLPQADAAPHPDAVAGVELLEADLAERGWVLSAALRQALTRLAVADLVSVGATLIADCDALLGADRPHVPLFRNFPDSTPHNTLAFFVERVLAAWFQMPEQPCVLCETDNAVAPVSPCGHLVCRSCFAGDDFSACPICHRRTDPNDPYFLPSRRRPQATSGAAPVRLRVLHLGLDVDADAVAELVALLGRPAALPPADVADLVVLLGTRSRTDLGWLPEAVPGRETKARLLAWLLAEPDAAGLEVAGRLIDTATDVLRLLVVLSGGEPSLIGRPRFAGVPRVLRRHLLGLLQRIDLEQLVEDMRRHERAWIRAGERLHPGEFADRYPTVAVAFAVLRRTDVFAVDLPFVPRNLLARGGRRVAVPSLGGRVEQHIAERRPGAAAELLAARRPGELVRRLDHLLRVPASTGQGVAVLDYLDAAVGRVAPAVLLAALGQLRTRKVQREQRVFFPASQASRAHVLPDLRGPLGSSVVDEAVAALDGELLRRAAGLPRVEVAVVDTDLDGVIVPFAERTAARSLVTLTRGSVMPLPTDRYLRLFCHWMQSPEQRVDLDLSVAFFDDGWEHVDTCDYTRLRAAVDGAVHSGDLTSAPAPLGASEFVDLDVEKMAKRARYAVMVIFSYNSVPFTDLPEAFAGWMLRADPPGHGEVFEARSVEQRFDLTGPSKATIPLVVDLRARTARWLDVAPQVTGTNHAVHRHNHQMADVASALVDSFEAGARVTVGEVGRIHAAGRADVVLLRTGGALVRFVRGPEETVEEFARRLRLGIANGPGTVAEAATAGLQVLARGDLPAPEGAVVYALHPGAVNAATVRLVGAADLAAELR